MIIIVFSPTVKTGHCWNPSNPCRPPLLFLVKDKTTKSVWCRWSIFSSEASLIPLTSFCHPLLLTIQFRKNVTGKKRSIQSQMLQMSSSSRFLCHPSISFNSLSHSVAKAPERDSPQGCDLTYSRTSQILHLNLTFFLTQAPTRSARNVPWLQYLESVRFYS